MFFLCLVGAGTWDRDEYKNRIYLVRKPLTSARLLSKFIRYHLSHHQPWLKSPPVLQQRGSYMLFHLLLFPWRVVKRIITFLKYFCLRYAVVTGANKGIGYEICRQLASNGILVVLTARDEKRGLEAVQKLKDSGISDDLVIYHQLDVVDPDSIVSLAEFVKNNFGKLDILVWSI